MVQAIREIVTVEEGGVVRLRSGQLSPGEKVELIVLMEQPLHPRTAPSSNGPHWRDFAGIHHSGDPRSGDNDRIDEDLAKMD
jgi:hypothetical protein